MAQQASRGRGNPARITTARTATVKPRPESAGVKVSNDKLDGCAIPRGIIPLSVWLLKPEPKRSVELESFLLEEVDSGKGSGLL